MDKKRIRLAVFAFFFLQGICFASWASRIPDIKTTLQLDDASWGTVLLMIPVGQITGMAFSGIIIPRIGSKRVLAFGMLGYAITLICIGLVSDKYSLLAALVVFGFFGNFCNIAVNTQGVTVEEMYNRPIMASFHGGWSLAGLCGACIGLLMSTLRIVPFYHFILVAVLTLAGILLNYSYLRQDKPSAQNQKEKQTARKNCPEPFLYLLGLIAFCGMTAEGAMMDWSGVYLQDIVNVQEWLAPIGLVAYMITMTSGRFIIDKVTHRWGRRRILQYAGTLIFSGLFLAVLIPHIVVTLFAFMIIGLGTAAIIPVVYSITGQQSNIPTGLALTIVSSISFLGFLLGPPLIGYVSHATSLRYSYALIGLFGITIILLSSQMKILRKQ
ncbi:MAG: MFS transporter [Tannerellaceae bacterium]|nr:MFS transporter [Tannerellaceae bacterium]